jgi:hypothetical protein
MTPDELPADMEGLAANLLADLSVLAATARGVPFYVWDRFANNVQQAAALLKAYQEQRWALEAASPVVPVGSGEPVFWASEWQGKGGVSRATHPTEAEAVENAKWMGGRYYALGEAAPVVPVGVSREEIIKAVRPVLDRHPMIDSSQSHKLDIQAGWVADAIIAALRPTDTGWRDITTAPKDGTMILVAYDDSAARTGRLEGPRERVYEAGWDEQQATFAARNGFLLHSAATHWMPLPPAPTDTGRE